MSRSRLHPTGGIPRFRAPDSPTAQQIVLSPLRTHPFFSQAAVTCDSRPHQPFSPRHNYTVAKDTHHRKYTQTHDGFVLDKSTIRPHAQRHARINYGTSTPPPPISTPTTKCSTHSAPHRRGCSSPGRRSFSCAARCCSSSASVCPSCR